MVRRDIGWLNEFSWGGMNPLSLALAEHDLESAEAMLRMGFLVDTNNVGTASSALTLFASQGDLAVVRWLLDHGARIAGHEHQDQAPIHSATRRGFREVVQELLNRGADPNAETLHGATALDLAAGCELRQLLVQKGGRSNLSQ